MTRWVLLRGLSREARHWGPLPDLLAQALPGARVLTPDLPGNGRRWRERSPNRIDAMVDALRTELQAFGMLLDASHAHHRYVFEPQSRHYLAHGDLWDHLHLQSLQRPRHVFLPLTLEMGSWLWVKKNPRQLFSRAGIFNPLIEHRQQRVLRRQLALLDFVMRAALSCAAWLPREGQRDALRQAALERWYRHTR